MRRRQRKDTDKRHFPRPIDDKPATLAGFYSRTFMRWKGKNDCSASSGFVNRIDLPATGRRGASMVTHDMPNDGLLVALLFLAAITYSSVGHAGASGYLAAMALTGVAPNEMKPAALVLNIVVATIATTRYARAGWVSWALLWPFAVGSIPAAYVGGWLQLPGHVFKPLVGVVLLIAAARLAMTVRRADHGDAPVPPKRPIAIASGAVLGVLAGLTGTGGGIFLTPLLLLMRWATTRHAAGVSAAFILVNSVAGLAGNYASVRMVPARIVWWIPAVLIGGAIGSELGARRLAPPALRYILVVVLIIAAGKLILT